MATTSGGTFAFGKPSRWCAKKYVVNKVAQGLGRKFLLYDARGAPVGKMPQCLCDQMRRDSKGSSHVALETAPSRAMFEDVLRLLGPLRNL